MIDLLLVTSTPDESLAVNYVLRSELSINPKPVTDGNRTYEDYGKINGLHVVHVPSGMGAGGPGGSRETIDIAVKYWEPQNVILTGIALGCKPDKQKLGDIVVSTQLYDYGSARYGESQGKDDPLIEISPRGENPIASPSLVSYFKVARHSWDNSSCSIFFGPILSGGLLIDNNMFLSLLQNAFKNSIGGEMEGIGLYEACRSANVNWIVVKAISDWGDGNKSQSNTAVSKLHIAETAVRFIVRSLMTVPFSTPIRRTAVNANISRHYLEGVREDCRNLQIQSILPGTVRLTNDPLSLADCYVPLNTSLQIPSLYASLEEYNLYQVPGSGSSTSGNVLANQPRRAVSLMEAVSANRATLLIGRPGSGKTTFLKWFAYQMACAGLDSSIPLPEVIGKEWGHGILLPVQISLRLFAVWWRTKSGAGANSASCRAGDIWAFIKQEYLNCGFPAETWDPFEKMARESGLFLFDGLDEAGDPNTRENIYNAIHEFITFSDAKCRFVLTARFFALSSEEPEGGLESGTTYRAPIRIYTVADLSTDQITEFLDSWFASLTRGKWIKAKDAQTQKGSLIWALENPKLNLLAQVPLFLMLMAMLHLAQGRLPEDRVAIYDESVKLLLGRWHPDAITDCPIQYENLRSLLQELAFQVLFTTKGTENPKIFSEEKIIEVFSKVIGPDRQKNKQLIEHLQLRTGIIIPSRISETGESTSRFFTFAHTTFLEYLAACYLADQPDFVRKASDLFRKNPDLWNEILILAARQAKASRGLPLVNELTSSGFTWLDTLVFPKNPRNAGSYFLRMVDINRTLLASEQLLEIGLEGIRASQKDSPGLKKVQALLVAAVPNQDVPPLHRIRAGRSLGLLGDPRPEITDVDQIRFCHVPRGKFYMWCLQNFPSEAAYKLHKSYAAINTSEYFIMKYPVTNAQFASFIHAVKGTQVDTLLKDIRGSIREKIKEQLFRTREMPVQIPLQVHSWSSRDLFSLPNHPIVNVSWYEAIAFCRWLTLQWRDLGWLGPEWQVRLPTEAEWEKAARGGIEIPENVPPSIAIKNLRKEADHRSIRLVDNSNWCRKHPWGDDVSTHSVRFPISVFHAVPYHTPGCFPTDVSPYGVNSLYGNIPEWTSSKYFGLPYTEEDGRNTIDSSGDERAFRGYRNHPPHESSCARRSSAPPMDKKNPNTRIGFRCVIDKKNEVGLSQK